MKTYHFMSLEQAINLLEIEVKQGKYDLPESSYLTEKQERMRLSGVPISPAFTKKDVHYYNIVKSQTQKYRGICYRIPIKLITKKLTMVCLLQNLDRTKKYVYSKT